MVKSSSVSTGKLNAFLRLHTRPINLVVFQGSASRTYFDQHVPPILSGPGQAPNKISGRFSGQNRCGNGILILEGASRLDAFSGYPFPT